MIIEHLNRDLRDLTPEELREIVSTGTRPICFAENVREPFWGFGSSFIFNYKGQVFVITAKHVIENNNVDYRHSRVLMRDSSMALPLTNIYTPDFPDHENREEVEDFVLFEVDDKLYTQISNKDLYSWKITEWSYPPYELEIGAQILIAGYPFTEDRYQWIPEDNYEWENQKIKETLLYNIGYLTDSVLGKGMYTFDGDPSELDYNGLSGSPVFCMRNGFVHFIGIATRGSSSSGLIHFLGVEFIKSALGFIENKKFTQPCAEMNAD